MPITAPNECDMLEISSYYIFYTGSTDRARAALAMRSGSAAGRAAEPAAGFVTVTAAEVTNQPRFACPITAAVALIAACSASSSILSAARR